MSGDRPVLSVRKGNVLTLTLNRPHVRNAIDLELARALLTAAVECDEDGEVRCVVMTGAGSSFSAGGDLRAFSAAGEKMAPLIKETTTYLHMAVTRLLRMQKPLITVIQGPVAGAGLGLALIGDFVLAAPAATFCCAYPLVGLTPDSGCSWLLPRLVGLRRAQELALTGRVVSADEAASIGLITRVCEPQLLTQEVEETSDRLACSATGALGKTRELLLSGLQTSIETQLDRESVAITDAARSANGKEGVVAFMEKRRPHFV